MGPGRRPDRRPLARRQGRRGGLHGAEWLRIGRRLDELPLISAAFADGQLSYSKVRTLTRLATGDNEGELLPIALETPASDLGVELARWLHRTTDPKDLAAYHHQQRSVRWRTDPDGMVVFTLRLPPLLAGAVIAKLRDRSDDEAVDLAA
ncbi:hypothetical protein KSP35_00400 [Aquihabitans sp. G128]|uniref:hypothetical protein n=1 Tax=Aquihabitans sp. G128 TaxID=2849779 RepID=UPI001C24C79E|nr:hypothetical protein [Aquihabitans sp. G128]QXC61352.1 hypothetical protein KSP35_00400 [Aquihabitans sp. G128]